MNQHLFPIRIFIEDTDFSGVVFHANYLKFFERARSMWAESLGFGIEWQKQQQVYFLVRYANIDFLKPARLNDECEVVSRLKEVRKASLIYDQYLRSKIQPVTIFCKAEIKIACVGANFRPRILPQSFMNLTTENNRDI